MVISYSSTDVGLPAESDPSESVEEPPIRKKQEAEPGAEPELKPEAGGNPTPSHRSREDICREAHVLDVEHVAAQLEVDFRCAIPSYAGCSELG